MVLPKGSGHSGYDRVDSKKMDKTSGPKQAAQNCVDEPEIDCGAFASGPITAPSGYTSASVNGSLSASAPLLLFLFLYMGFADAPIFCCLVMCFLRVVPREEKEEATPHA